MAQIIKLGQKLTDDAVTMFIKLMGRLFSQANSRKKQRHMDCRPEPPKHCGMFLDTITGPAVGQRQGCGTRWRCSTGESAGIGCSA